MALNLSGLKSAIQDIAANPRPSTADAAAAWASAMQTYATAIVPPSTTVTAAASALSTALAGAFAAPLAAPGMEVAFTAFALAVSGGMAPGFVGVPPPLPVGFAAQFAGAMPASHADAADQMGSLIDLWMKTGTATPSGGGASTPWS